MKKLALILALLCVSSLSCYTQDSSGIEGTGVDVNSNTAPPPVALPFTITTIAIPQGIAGTPYSAALVSNNGVVPVSWSCPSGCGGGLTITGSGVTINASTGAIAGASPVAGTYSITVLATDSSTSGARTATQALTLTIGSAPPPFQITTTSIPTGTGGAAYSTLVTAANGVGAVAWSCPAGCAGLTITGSGVSIAPGTGILSGSNPVAGVYNFTLGVTDSTPGTPQTDTQALTLTIGPPFTITTTSLPQGKSGTVYGPITLATANGANPITWACPIGCGVGLTVGGVSLNPSTGFLAERLQL